MSSEKSFQNYFMRLANGYRTALVNGGGFPDILLISGEHHFLVELKMLKIGPSGDKMLRGLYQKSQMPWHLDYFLVKGGKSLYTVFKLEACYGIIKECPDYCRDVLDGIKYKHMKEVYDYKEYKTLKELIEKEFK